MSDEQPPGTAEGFTSALARYFDLEPDEVVPSARFVEDLTFDSLMVYELQVFLEDLLPHEPPEDLLESIETVGDLVGLWESYRPEAT